MPRQYLDSHIAGGVSPRRRRRTAPLRRILAGGLCAGAALLSATSAAQAEPRKSVPAFPAAGGRCENGYCKPYCPPSPHQYAPYYAPSRQPFDMAPPQPPGDLDTPSRDGDSSRAPDADTTTPDLTAPDTTTPTTPSAPNFSSASAATGTPSAPASASPNMIGDFFGSGGKQASIVTLGIASDPSFGFGGRASVIDPNESTVGRIKQAENFNPLPMDRVFLDYSTYQNVPIGTKLGAGSDVNVQRFTPGFERTFLDGMMSVEVRMPVAVTLDSTVNVTGTSDNSHFEPGNLNAALKTLLFQNEKAALTAGLGVRTPTANDLVFAGGTTIVEVENNSVHLLPFLGMLLTPNETFFGQVVMQVDVDANGNSVFLTSGGGPRTFQDDLEDQTYLFTSFSVGAWLYDNPCSSSLTSAAGTLELHNSTTVSDPDAVNTASLSITEGKNSFSSSSIIAGLHLFYAGGAQVTFGYGLPVGEDRFADSEFRTLLSRNY